MSETASVKRGFYVKRSTVGRITVIAGAAPPSPPPGRLPRVTRLLALAIHFDELLRAGAVSSQAELARLGQVSRPRLTQIMNLLYLAPEIQEAILFHAPITSGRSLIHERELRSISHLLSWQEQLLRFAEVSR